MEHTVVNGVERGSEKEVLKGASSTLSLGTPTSSFVPRSFLWTLIVDKFFALL